MVLNFGHTLGHAVEALTHYDRFKHGEAVAIGMVFAAELSSFLGNCDDETVERIKPDCKVWIAYTTTPI